MIITMWYHYDSTQWGYSAVTINSHREISHNYITMMSQLTHTVILTIWYHYDFTAWSHYDVNIVSYIEGHRMTSLWYHINLTIWRSQRDIILTTHSDFILMSWTPHTVIVITWHLFDITVMSPYDNHEVVSLWNHIVTYLFYTLLTPW